MRKTGTAWVWVTKASNASSTKSSTGVCASWGLNLYWILSEFETDIFIITPNLTSHLAPNLVTFGIVRKIPDTKCPDHKLSTRKLRTHYFTYIIILHIPICTCCASLKIFLLLFLCIASLLLLMNKFYLLFLI